MTNNQLHSTAGSELLTIELAEGLTRRGHDVSIFTLYPGALANSFRARKLGVLTPNDKAKILEAPPDAIAANHWTTLAVLRQIGVSAPSILSCLGTLPALENPPQNFSNSLLGWAVSEETAGNLEQRLGAFRRVEVIGNWYPPGFDVQHRTVRKDRREGRPRGLIVSNHLPKDYKEMLFGAAALANVELVKVGLPEKVVRVDENLLGSYDFVVSIARTAIQAAAFGLPVLLLDQSKLDGWITSSTVSELARYNYSGRRYHQEPTEELIFRLLSNIPSATEVQRVREYILASHDPKTCAARIENLLIEAIAESSYEDFGPVAKVFGATVSAQHSWRYVLNLLLQKAGFWSFFSKS